MTDDAPPSATAAAATATADSVDESDVIQCNVSRETAAATLAANKGDLIDAIVALNQPTDATTTPSTTEQ